MLSAYPYGYLETRKLRLDENVRCVRDRELSVFTHAAREHTTWCGLHSHGSSGHNAGPAQPRQDSLIVLRGLPDASHDHGDRLHTSNSVESLESSE